MVFLETIVVNHNAGGGNQPRSSERAEVLSLQPLFPFETGSHIAKVGRELLIFLPHLRGHFIWDLSRHKGNLGRLITSSPEDERRDGVDLRLLHLDPKIQVSKEHQTCSGLPNLVSRRG